MKKTNKLSLGLLLGVCLSGTAVAAPPSGIIKPINIADNAQTFTTVYPVARSHCRQYQVTWSGGVALRGPNLIRPDPVRNRWQGAQESRIRCADRGVFRQRRVADEPWIH